MTVSRRTFLSASAAALGAAAVPEIAHAVPSLSAAPPGYGPWLEIDAQALAHNVRTVARLAGGRPVIAVAKNNAYGLGLATAGPLLAALEPVWGLAVVRADEAAALRAAGVRKPILLMGPCADDEVAELAGRDVRFAPASEEDGERIVRVARRLGLPVGVHLYIDTGMHRMGMPHARAPVWIEALAATRMLRIEGAFTELTEDPDHDRQQASRLRALADEARRRGVRLGLLHAASSDAVMRGLTEAHLDAVRPGLALYGGYVSAEARTRGELRCAYRLKSRVIRVERLAAGDGVSYHRRWVAERPTWIATLAVGHVDGYPSGAVKGGEVLIGGRPRPVIGTVSASHTIVELGDERAAAIGDEAILVGPDHPAIHPNEIAARAGWSEYNMFMHLGPMMTRVRADG
jgi:alanine racemase